MLRSGNLIIATDPMRNLPEVELLHNKGYIVDFLPIPDIYDSSNLGRRMWHSQHIDTELNIIKIKDGFLFVVNNDYYQAFNQQVDRLVSQYQGVLRIIQNSAEQTFLRGVNFIEVDGKIILPENCRKTRSLIGGVIGDNNVLSAKVDCSMMLGKIVMFTDDGQVDIYLHGGLRCLSNIVL